VLQQLTLLQLDVWTMVNQLPEGAPGVFSGLQQLQELTLKWDDCTSLDMLQGVTPSLTKLKLIELTSPECFSISSVPALAGFSVLQHLEVLLSSRSNGKDCGFVSSLPQVAQLRVLCFEGSLGGDTVHELLNVLPRMTNLVHLDVVSAERWADRYFRIEPQPASDVTRYTALLPASPQLTHFAFTSYVARMLPVGCGSHVFATRLHLPNFRVLCLGPAAVLDDDCQNVLDRGCSYSGPWRYLYYNGWDREEREFEDQPACFGPGDVERLVCCCPALERLWLPGLVQPGVDVSALLQLTALTGLLVGGDVWNDNVSVSVLAGMTGLRQLELCDAPGLSDQGLLALAALTNLTELRALHCGLTTSLCWPFNDAAADREEDKAYVGLSAQVG
jgi:hypothetical protein